MFKIYEIHNLEGLKLEFKFKLDLNIETDEYEPHIWIRHLLEPEQVIAAFLNISEQEYNLEYKRWEAYSKVDNLNIYYIFLNKRHDKVMIITAFKI